MATLFQSPSPSHKVASLVLVLVLLASLYGSCRGSESRIHPGRDLLGTQRRNNGSQNQIPSCNDMSSESQCSRNPKCRWCRSDVLNDMCFPKLEALRLPPQVFSCKIDYSRLNRNHEKA
ncbi:hypothetical protein Pyn_19832 [Prunus yedoensis var. nudiflora]|uniref:Uncharacterized protein n=1 Tax=Prunus yedoensis var. nudiflora TaxID=2094558 RepID=A0A314ZWE5_PRUYE|nr:hypothetical protein Pyn_19832 [Prunus yedoensis var. nudiflora]